MGTLFYKIAFTALVLFVLVFLAGARIANAAVILGNLPASDEIPGADIGFGTQIAVKFTMGSSSRALDEVVLRVKTNASGSNVPAIDIRNDGGTLPGNNVLFTIEGTTDLPTGGTSTVVANYKLSATSSFTLNASTSYWFVVRAKAGTFEWWANNPPIDPSGPSATYVAPYKATSNDGGAWSDSPPIYGQGSFQLINVEKNALLNVSTRLNVGTGDNVLIGGVILVGSGIKTVILRAVGPSLSGLVPNPMNDPKVELFDGSNNLIARNDNWKTTQIGGLITNDQVAEIQASGVAPTNDAEAALIVKLPAGNATAVLRGANDTTGIAVVEAYDLDQPAGRIGNISTRGFVQTGDGAMIGGFIIGNQTTMIVVRAIGPSLTAFNVPTPLMNPTLELRDVNGALIESNNNWKTRDSDGTSQQAAIEALGLAPSNDLESTIVATLVPGNYTGIVRGVNNGTGNALVEAYNLQ